MSPIRMEKIEFASRTVLAYLEAINRRDISGMADLLAEKCVWEAASPLPEGVTIAGREEIRRRWEEIFRGTPSLGFEVEEVFGIGERCVLRWKAGGEAAPGGKPLARGVDIYRVRNGAIQEIFSFVKG